MTKTRNKTAIEYNAKSKAEVLLQFSERCPLCYVKLLKINWKVYTSCICDIQKST